MISTKRLLLCCIVALLAGCGGGGETFDRAPVSGTVNLDGKPPAYARILFEGPANEQSLSAKSIVAVEGGKFSADGSTGPQPGENKIRITFFEAAPTQTEDGQEDADEIGYWSTTKVIEGEAPLTFDVKASELKKD